MSLVPLRLLRQAFSGLPTLPKNLQTIETQRVFVTELPPLASKAEQEAMLREEIRQRAARLCLYGDTLRAKTARH